MTPEQIKDIADAELCGLLDDYTSHGVFDFARAIEARVLEELRKQGPVGFGCFDLAGFLDQDLVGTEADCIFWRDSPDATNKWTVKALFTAPIPTPSQEEALDAKRWRYYADCPQTALMLGTELDPNSEQDWAAECSRLVDASLARPDTEGSKP